MNRQKKVRPGIVEVAQAAGVSTATVDRVLNNRGGVRAATRQRVLDAAKALGYAATPQGSGHVQAKALRIIFLLPKGTNPYIKHLAELIGSGDLLPRTQNSICRHEFVEGFDAAALAEGIEKCIGKYDGIAIMGLEHPLVREAVNNAARRGTPVVTIITDLSHSARAAFVGLDNRAVGRTAAHLLASICNTSEGDIGLDCRQLELSGPQ